MADNLGMDPARIERLRSPDRLTYFDPAVIWDVLQPAPGCTLVDIGTGVGYIALPFAERYPGATVYGCDILEGMIALLREDAAERGLGNLHALAMQPNAIDLPDGSADIVIMAQLHHELDDPDGLLRECMRLLHPSGTVAVVDWKDEDNGKSPPPGRRVPEAVIAAQLQTAGFKAIQQHDVYQFHSFLVATA